jgi:hypothetical protein
MENTNVMNDDLDENEDNTRGSQKNKKRKLNVSVQEGFAEPMPLIKSSFFIEKNSSMVLSNSKPTSSNND